MSGMDGHQASIAICVMNAAGKVVVESIIETKVQTVRDFIKGLRGEAHVTFEEGTQAAWLYGLMCVRIIDYSGLQLDVT